MNNYNLIFHEVATGKRFTGRRLADGSYSVIDTTTGQNEKVSAWHLSKRFVSDASNKKKRGGYTYRFCKKISA